MPLEVSWEDIMSFQYKRDVHLILLLAILVADVAVIALSILIDGYVVLYASMVAVLLYLLCWFLRGWSGCAKCFPAFHYISLVVEWVLHLVHIAYLFRLLYEVALASREDHWYLWWVLNVLVFLVIYLMLAYKLTPVVGALFTRNQADYNEIRSGSA